MTKVTITTLLAVLLTGCFQAQRSPECDNTGVLRCEDQPSELRQPDSERTRALSSGASSPRPKPEEQVPEVVAPQYLERHEHPWSRPLDECMAAGGLRSECFENLPPDILVQFEAWEAERATIRRQLLQQRRQPENSPSLGVEPKDANTGD